MAQILDLRKKQKKEAVLSVNPRPSKKETAVPILPLKPVHPQISWEAPSFYFNPQKRYLSLLIIALALAGGAMLFWQKDTLTAIFLVLSSLVLILYSNKRPEISRITVDQKGIAIGDTLHYYKDLRSFWLHYDPGNAKELSLESKRWYMPYVKISIENNNPLEIRSLMINFLPEKEHENSLVDIIARKIGL